MDMFQPMYELLIVSLPSRFIHENDGCDPEVMKFLNSSDTPQDNKNEVDPRWEALNKLN